MVGLVLIAGAIAYFLIHPSTPPDSPGVAAVAVPVGPPPETVAGAAEQATLPVDGEEISQPDSPAAVIGPSSPAESADSAPAAPAQAAPSSFDARISAMVDTIQTCRAMGPAARQRISSLLASPEPQDQVSGLALLAGLEMLDAQYDVSKHSPEVVLAAVDLCESLFSDSSARALLEQWMERMGGAQTASEMAHRLLVEARLPFGGGSAALERMISVNDPQAILVGLYEFAVNVNLPPATRSEALFLLRDHMEPAAYGEIVQDCIRQVREDGDAWVDRAERLLAWMAKSTSPDRPFIESAFAQPYPGMLEDLGLYLRHEFEAGRLALDAETATAFRNSLATLDEPSLAGPDRAALQSLRRQLDAWATAR